MVSVMLMTGTVMYLCSSSSKEIDENTSQVFGGFATPPHTMSPKLMRLGRLWASDNGCFTREFDEDIFFGFLERASKFQETNLFVACPDVVGDGEATLKKFKIYSDRIRSLGYKVALVTQDGMKLVDGHVRAGNECIRLDDVDWLFIGGTDEHKNSGWVIYMIRVARSLGINVHVGRVNTKKRLKYFMRLGVQTVDGTHINFSPRKNLQDLERWIKEGYV